MVVWTEGNFSGVPASGFEANYDPDAGPISCIVNVKAGDTLALPVSFVDDTTDEAEVLTSDEWAAHVRWRPSGEKICEFTVDTTDKATGLLVLRMEPEYSALLRTGMRTDLVDTSVEYTWLTIQWQVQGDYTHA